LKELTRAALALKLNLEKIETLPNTKVLKNVFQTAKQKKIDGIITTVSRSFFAERKRIVEPAVKYRLPAINFQKEFADEGRPNVLRADFTDLYRKAAGYVDKILQGAKPAHLPVQQATKFEFVINLKTAEQIGVTISPDLLARATKIIR
jgi:putative ABC transport system substrate-binding protein